MYGTDNFSLETFNHTINKQSIFYYKHNEFSYQEKTQIKNIMKTFNQFYKLIYIS